MSQIRLFATIEFIDNRPNSFILANSFFTRERSLCACSVVKADTESNSRGNEKAIALLRRIDENSCDPY